MLIVLYGANCYFQKLKCACPALVLICSAFGCNDQNGNAVFDVFKDRNEFHASVSATELHTNTLTTYKSISMDQ